MVSEEFRSLIRAEGARLYRDLPWRRTRDPYHIWLSEVMLQQTQVARVETRMPAWLERFPSVEALADAPTSDVLEAWQGMGYNRRALALKRAAQEIMERYDGAFPRETKELVALPGIGPATAQGIRAFAFDLPGVYLETNVRTVFLHHFFPDVPAVPDRELTPLVEATCPLAPEGIAARTDGASGAERFAVPQDAEDTPRSWYYALLDYGAYLKKTLPNPSRRSAAYTRQSRFEGRVARSAQRLSGCCSMRAMQSQRALPCRMLCANSTALRPRQGAARLTPGSLLRSSTLWSRKGSVWPSSAMVSAFG